MKRLFTLLSVMSLVLCVGVLVLWARSYFVAETIYRESRRHRPASERIELCLFLSDGHLYLRRSARIYKAIADENTEVEPVSARRAAPGNFISIALQGLSPARAIFAVKSVNTGGTVSLPELGSVRAQGRTPAQIAQAVRDAYDEARIIQYSNVRVEFTQARRPFPRRLIPDGPEEKFLIPADATSWSFFRYPPIVLLSQTYHFSRSAIGSPAFFQWQRMGLEVRSARLSAFTHSFTEWQGSFPIWWACVPCALLPAKGLSRAIRGRFRVMKNHCRSCGYDLRATTDRCPECGTIPRLNDG